MPKAFPRYVAIVFSLSCHSCLAWWAEGHMLVAAVAWDRLTDKVRSEVERLLLFEGAAAPDGRYVPQISAQRERIIPESITSKPTVLAYMELMNTTLVAHNEDVTGPCLKARDDWPVEPQFDIKSAPEDPSSPFIDQQEPKPWAECAAHCAKKCNAHDDCAFFEHNPWHPFCHCRLFHRYCVASVQPEEHQEPSPAAALLARKLQAQAPSQAYHRGCGTPEDSHCSRFYEKVTYPPTDYISSFTGAAIWPDEIKRRGVQVLTPGVPGYMGAQVHHKQWEKWHYTSYPYADGGSCNLPEAAHELPSLVWALEQLLATLGDASGNRWARGFALRMVVHLVGDLHQPFHSIERCTKDLPEGDRGGGLFHLKGTYNNLHNLWDSMGGSMVKMQGLCHYPLEDFFDTCYAKRQERENMAFELAREWTTELLPADVDFQEAATPQEVAEQMHEKAIEFYGGVVEGEHPSDEYVAMVQQETKRFVVLAGYRLAHLLNKHVQRSLGDRSDPDCYGCYLPEHSGDGEDGNSDHHGNESCKDEWWLGYVLVTVVGLCIGHLATRVLMKSGGSGSGAAMSREFSTVTEAGRLRSSLRQTTRTTRFAT